MKPLSNAVAAFAMLPLFVVSGCGKREAPAPPRGSAKITVNKATTSNVRDRWDYRLDSEMCLTAPLVHGDLVFVADYYGVVYAIDHRNGERKWKTKLSAGVDASPNYRNGRLFVGDVDGGITCLDAATGDTQWTYATEGTINAAASFYRDAVLIGSQDSYLYCLSVGKGELIWKFKASHQIRAPAIVVEKNYCLVIGSCSSRLHVVDLHTGKESRQCHLRGETIGAFAVRADHVFLGDMRGNVSAIDWRHGEELWSNELDPVLIPEVRCGPALADHVVLVGSSDRYVRGFDITTGNRIWQFPSKGAVDTPIQVRGDRAFVTTSRGVIHVLSVRDGTELRKEQLDSPTRAALAFTEESMIAALANGTVVCRPLRQHQ